MDIKEVDVTISNKNSTNTVISLDKGIYKPGDEVQFRALLLSKSDDKPIEDEVEVSIYDANGNRVYIQKTKSSQFGIVSGKFELADEVNSGEYKICVSTKDVKSTKTFTVNPYVTPTFEVAVETAQDTYALGSTADISIKAKYFFGEPVANATVKGTFDGEEFAGITNEEGIFVYQKQLNKIGQYDVDAQVIDTSNYLIEAKKTIYASSNAFEIEVLPENGDIIKGIENKIYLITKKVDGTPVKARIELRFGNISRQVVTDESGIGSFSINDNDLENINYGVSSIHMIATDMNNAHVSSSYKATVREYEGTVITLDKIKYKQNEDITLKLNSITDVANKEILVYKNKNLIKAISTDLDEVTFNLEDTYGLIDIYTKNNISRNRWYEPVYNTGITTDSIVAPDYDYNYTYNDYSKKTIFISPEKHLDIDIKADKQEYKPGENLNLSFTTKDENDRAVDTALLVSILDEAVLSLADNDLSIDNIKLALEDIELTDEITAADLYAEVLDETAENKLRLVLLRQGTEDPYITKITSYYNEQHQKYIINAVLFGTITVLFAFIAISTKYKKFKTGIIALINIVVTFLILSTCFYEFLYYELDLSEITTVIALGIVSIILYVLLLYKFSASILHTVMNLAVIPLILALALSVVYGITDSELLVALGLLLPAIVMTILIVISRKHKLNKFLSKVKEITIQCTKSEVIYVIASVISDMLCIYSQPIIIIIVLVLYWISQRVYNCKKYKADTSATIEFNSATLTAILVAMVGFVLFGYIYNSSTNSINEAVGVPRDDVDLAFDAGVQNTEAMTKTDSMLDMAQSFIDSSSSSVLSKDKIAEAEVTNEIAKNETETVSKENIEENVRNIFLESLAFIPELVTENGKADTSIKISDNITTWNIQAIGNTKDGKVGFNSSTFKVFKEFFIDFTLPTNSVVTDKTSIPVTIYNYTDNELTVNLAVKENEWSKIEGYQNSVNVLANSTKMVYVPLELLKPGEQTLRIEATANGVSDIVEKSLNINPNGFKKTKVVSSGSVEKTLNLDHFTTEPAIDNSRKMKIKLYPSVISQVIEGMENIFRMPTGCFEQTSSSLYPNILALKYLEDNGLDAPEVKEKALEYISKGYQRILSFETSKKGGYSLYGDDPAENVLTAFGLMELTDLQSVYEIDENVTNNMIEYLFDAQNINGTFEIDSTYIGSASSTDDLAMNAYIIWALSEACPDDERLDKSVKYLEDKLSKAEDNYTIALMANVFSNTKSKSVKNAISKLMESVNEEEDGAYISSNIRDYWGTYGRYQDVQTTALTSMALTKEHMHNSTNNSLLKYIIKSKDEYGTWSTTQSTILALKAINSANANKNVANQKIEVAINNEVKEVEIKDNPLDLYELSFDKINDENKISIKMKKGDICYEIVEEYYVEYDKINESENKVKIEQILDTTAKVNDILHQNITVTNTTSDEIMNGLVQISIPQGCSVNEEALARLKHLGFIEKYEYNYSTINLYIRNFAANASLNLDVEYRANYPEQITGGMVRAYDYYNPSNEGFAKPEKIVIN